MALDYEVDSDSFWAKVDKRGLDECWPWTGYKTPTGYGTVSVKRNWDGRHISRRAHRIAFELTVGPVPDELEMDHICHSWGPRCERSNHCPHRACCNPAHLRAVTQAVNTARKQARERDRCPKGHAYIPENIKIGSKGEIKCKQCHRDQSRARTARLRAEHGLPEPRPYTRTPDLPVAPPFEPAQGDPEFDEWTRRRASSPPPRP